MVEKETWLSKGQAWPSVSTDSGALGVRLG